MLTNISQENRRFPGIGKKLEKHRHWKRITIIFQEQFVKETVQHKAYCLQSLIGNAGGYVGLFIGTAAYDIPTLLTSFFSKFQK